MEYYITHFIIYSSFTSEFILRCILFFCTDFSFIAFIFTFMYLFPYIQKSHNISLVFFLSLTRLSRVLHRSFSSLMKIILPRLGFFFFLDFLSFTWKNRKNQLSMMMSPWRAAIHWSRFWFCFCDWSRHVTAVTSGWIKEYLHHPHLHFNTALIHHTDTSTGTFPDGGRRRNATVQRQATERETETGVMFAIEYYFLKILCETEHIMQTIQTVSVQ